MINFFRKTRKGVIAQKELKKYVVYSIGEIILMVIGILIALEINNWNEERKQDNKKEELIENLLEDFDENITLLNIAISESDLKQRNMNAFFDNAYKPSLTISVDSLKTLSYGFFRASLFTPANDTYDEAKSSGNFSLLKNKDLSKKLTQLQQHYNFFLSLKEQGLDAFFQGSVWELQKTIGPHSKLMNVGRNKNFIQEDLDLNDYLELINSPLAIASFENWYIIERNTNETLKQMHSICLEIEKSLSKIKGQN